MDRQKSCKKDALKISEDVIASIARTATLEIEGIDELAPARSTIKNVFIKSKQGYIVVQPMGDVVEITVGVIVKYGYKISQVAERVQQNVKENVQAMTGIAVSRVNVFVSSVAFDD